MKRTSTLSVWLMLVAFSMVAQTSKKTTVISSPKLSTDKPNILVIWGDDIGWENVSAYGLGVMGYRTPGIDRIAKEGAMFTTQYAQPSCTAGRVSFITGQYPIRSGMTTVGMPGDALGLKAQSPCLAEVMKKQGYATGHFGKNHLGDHNDALPTAHGFDEFYGNLYHLNTQEEAEQLDYKEFARNYPGGPAAYKEKFGTRDVIHSVATNVDDPTVDARYGKVGKQKIENEGPLTRERMKSFDSVEVIPRAEKFMLEAKKAGKPFFLWLNATKTHMYVRTPPHWTNVNIPITSEADANGAGLRQHDADVAAVLDFLDKNGLAENTVVWYSTDNGPEHSSWPDGGTTPFRGEKMTTYEGGMRVISMVRWPGQIKPGTVLDGIQAHMDMFTTFAAIAGVKDVNADILAEKKQYLDGVNNLDYWTGKSNHSNRDEMLYYYESNLMAIRVNQWKMSFSVKEYYESNVIPLSFPHFNNLHEDPLESYEGHFKGDWLLQKCSWLVAPIKERIAAHIKTLEMYPPVQRGNSFDMSHIMDALSKSPQ